MNQNSAIVPFYGLYGDAFVDNDPGFVHIEDIATRSSGLDWKIKPHRHARLFQVLCIFDSELDIVLQDSTHALRGSWIVTLPMGAIHGFSFQPGSRGFVLSIMDTVLSDELGQGPARSGRNLFRFPQLIEFDSEAPTSRSFLNSIERIRAEFRHQYTERHLALAMLSRLALLDLDRQLQQHHFGSISGRHDMEVLGRFRALLEQHYSDHWPVSQYAERLHMSTSTLGRLCRRILNRSPKRLIDERLVNEARRRLMYTRQPLAEISYTLGFKDYAYFSRFFKHHEGITAGIYRKRSEATTPPDGSI
ncbi:helix-turn-helix domain-containing protein [Parahaliea mediterranea]|uniref:Helix-turn-helix domain-containing protein n=1 Tax=Parahaliea mediterranea TaxID=651086 RepID=A0A939DE64_9GAMM|nr:helix-turn-helix domain-containing protein [Parahaliea mediterranea]MBN7796459.1 helix-turn-helix domain-containing protein [Parahaliea mediterranea]